MRHGQLLREGARCTDHGRRGVTLDDEHIGVQIVKNLVKIGRGGANKLRQIPNFTWDRERDVRFQSEMAKHRQGHVLVLATQADSYPE